MTDETATLPRTIPAATVVVFRNDPREGPPELLMVQRTKEMRFAGGAAVFPGGRIDPEDIALARQCLSDTDLDEAAARIAGIRETLEETGLMIGVAEAVSATDAARARSILLDESNLAAVLDQMDWTLAPELLVPFARWRPNWEGAFDTHFFLADLGTGAVDIAIDATENTRLFWTSAVEALKLADQGEISVIFPTRRNLDRLAQFASFAEACDDAAGFPIVPISAARELREGEEWLCIPEGLGYPITAERMATVRRG